MSKLSFDTTDDLAFDEICGGPPLLVHLDKGSYAESNISYLQVNPSIPGTTKGSNVIVPQHLHQTAKATSVMLKQAPQASSKGADYKTCDMALEMDEDEEDLVYCRTNPSEADGRSESQSRGAARPGLTISEVGVHGQRRRVGCYSLDFV